MTPEEFYDFHQPPKAMKLRMGRNLSARQFRFTDDVEAMADQAIMTHYNAAFAATDPEQVAQEVRRNRTAAAGAVAIADEVLYPNLRSMRN